LVRQKPQQPTSRQGAGMKPKKQTNLKRCALYIDHMGDLAIRYPSGIWDIFYYDVDYPRGNFVLCSYSWRNEFLEPELEFLEPEFICYL
jgi:hypothetical protein